MVAWSLKCNMELDFHELEKKIVKNQHTICISAGFPFHTLGLQVAIFQYQEFYRTTKVNGSTKTGAITNLKKS